MTLTIRRQPTIPVALALSVSTNEATTVVTLVGEADISTRSDVVDTLARAIAEGDGPVVIDLVQTEFIDTSIARVLDRAWQFLADRDRQLILRSPSEAVLRVLDFFNLSRLIEPSP